MWQAAVISVCSRSVFSFDLPSTPCGVGNSTPLQYSCLENPMDRGAWRATVHGVAESQTRLSDFTFTFHFHALEKEMATHSRILAWRIPGRGSLMGCRLWGSHRVGHDWSDLAAALHEHAYQEHLIPAVFLRPWLLLLCQAPKFAWSSPYSLLDPASGDTHSLDWHIHLPTSKYHLVPMTMRTPTPALPFRENPRPPGVEQLHKNVQWKTKI